MLSAFLFFRFIACEITMIEKYADLDYLKAEAAGVMDLGVSYGLNLVTAIVLIIAGVWGSKILANLARDRLSSIEGMDQTLIPVVVQVVRYGILVFTFILVLAEFGVQTASIIAVVGAAGLAIGLALQGTLQNVAAGIMLLVIRPIRVGDYVEAGGAGGTVKEIGLFMTRMHTSQGLFISVPNSKIFSDTITNYSMNNTRRIDLLVGIAYEDDIDKAVLVLSGLLESDKRIMKSPSPVVVVKALGESSVDLEIRAWARRTQYWDARFDLTRAVKYALDEAGISIPYPHRQVVLAGQGMQIEQVIGCEIEGDDEKDDIYQSQLLLR